MKRVLIIICTITFLLNMNIIINAQPSRTGFGYRTQFTEEVEQLKGEITNILHPLATLKTQGKEYTIHLGSSWYWKKMGYKLSMGEVEMTGVIEEVDDEWHFYPLEITQGETTIDLSENMYPSARRSRYFRKPHRSFRRHHHHRGYDCWHW